MKESDARSQAEKPLTIKSVTTRAKEVLLKAGRHYPTLIAEGDQRTVSAELDLPTTSAERQHYLFMHGITIAMHADIGVLQQAFLVTEGWMRVAPADETRIERPSEAPQQQEVLVISNIKVFPPSTQLTIYQMIREGKTLTDLREYGPATEADVQNRDYLLEAFAMGYQLTTQGRN